MERTVAAYFAGLIDGEGTITLEKRGNNYLPCVSMTNTDRKLIDAISAAFPGGTTRTRPRRDGQKTAYEIRWRHDRALYVIDSVVGFLIGKLAVARLVLSWRHVVRRNGKYRPIEVSAISALVANVRLLNTRGTPKSGCVA